MSELIFFAEVPPIFAFCKGSANRIYYKISVTIFNVLSAIVCDKPGKRLLFIVYRANLHGSRSSR